MGDRIALDNDEKYILAGKVIEEKNTLYLFEWIDYYLTVPKEYKVFFGDEPADEVSEGVFRYIFKNYIGTSVLRILKDGHIVLERPLLVLSKKFAQIAGIREDEIEERISDVVKAYREFVDTILGDIQKHSLELPFSLSAPTRFEFIESDEPVNEFFAYHFLKNNDNKIIGAFETVIHRAKRKLIVEGEWVKPWESDSISADSIISMLRHPEYLMKAEGSSALVAQALGGYVPTKVLTERKYESFDTPENRFAKHFLNNLLRWSERVLEAFRNAQSAKLDRIMGLYEELEYLANDPLWDDVGEMVIFPYTSQVLLKHEGYRDLLQLWWEFRSYSPFFDEMQKAIDNKDIAKLYEYWCFFRLVEELGKILGRKDLRIIIEPTGELAESGNVYALFDNGWRLYYNKRLTPRKWSYSVSLRPDYSLFNGNPNKKGTKILGVFDAKFKLDVVDEKEEIENFDVEDEEVERSGSYTTWTKLEDIYKMHTYRDALNANFAVVLYPGDRSVFFETNNDKRELWGLSELVSSENVKIGGIGYLKFRPKLRG